MSTLKETLYGMTMVRGYPPNYKEIVAAFPAVKKYSPIFCYGKTIYYTHPDAPNGEKIVHESVHSNRQGDDPAGWWKRYIEDTQFRFFEELIAHRAELGYFKSAGRKTRRFQLHQIAKNLSSPLYGGMLTRKAAQGWLLHEFGGESLTRNLDLAIGCVPKGTVVELPLAPFYLAPDGRPLQDAENDGVALTTAEHPGWPHGLGVTRAPDGKLLEEDGTEVEVL